MPPFPTLLSTSVWSIGKRDAVGLRRRQHIRRQLPDRPGEDTDTEEDDDDDEEEEGLGELTTDDEGPPRGPAVEKPPPPAAAPAPSPPPPTPSPPAVNPPPAPAAAATTTQPVPVLESAASTLVVSAAPVTFTETVPAGSPLFSTAVEPLPDSLPTGFITVTNPIFITPTSDDFSTTFTIEAGGDSEQPTATVVVLPPPPPPPPFFTPPDATGTNTPESPGIAPTNPEFVYSDGPPPESRTAVIAAVSIISISLVCGILYCLLRFCPPVRDRWVAFKTRRKHERQKRMGVLEESPLPPPVVVVNGQQQPSTWATGGLGVRNVGVENGVLRPLSAAHLRPPSYRSHWTQSGASWVANGFRVPERLSRRMRWSDRSGRGRFMGRATRLGSDTDSVSSIEEGGLIADGLRPPMPPMKDVSRISATTASPLSGGQSPESIGGGSGSPSSRSHSGRSSRSGSAKSSQKTHSQAGFSTRARISDMSSLSAGTTSNTFRPPPVLTLPIGIARGSGSGLMP